jgi:hypothetical protein
MRSERLFIQALIDNVPASSPRERLCQGSYARKFLVNAHALRVSSSRFDEAFYPNALHRFRDSTKVRHPRPLLESSV